MDAVENALSDAWQWLTDEAFRLVFIILLGTVLAYVLARAIRFLLARIIGRGLSSLATSEWDEGRRLIPRLRTLEAVINRSVGSIVAVGVAIFVASDLGLRIEPLLASAGLVGVAVAFGSQTIVRDALSGVFLLTEGTYNVGDYVRLNAVEGIVTDISLRRTRLLGDDGTVHTIPNGAITVTSNFTREAAQHTMTLRVKHETPIAAVEAALREVRDELNGAPEVGEDLVSGPTLAGITAIRGTTYDVEIRSAVRPGLRATWPRLLNGRLLAALRNHEVAIAD